MMEPLAHSARSLQGIPEQPYEAHIVNVTTRAEQNAVQAAWYHNGNGKAFVDTVRACAISHDLGKLDGGNQKALHAGPSASLPVNHVDAGVTHLLKYGLGAAAFLVAGHHAPGLRSLIAEYEKGDECLRDLSVKEKVDKKLAEYERLHNGYCLNYKLPVDTESAGVITDADGLKFRLALSCLVDADHGDTARHYQKESDIPPPLPRWRERLQALDAYVVGLSAKAVESERNLLRDEIYGACRDAPIEPPIRACDSPVGSGKTTAVMAHLLQVAIAKNLRHIIVVLPYTNIIRQSVATYREALKLEGEREEEIVAEHHHQADFDSPELRHLTTLWKSPVIVTTAVQFFETLASNQPARLRKLHELPGSAVFLDEAHAAIPTWLWPQTWRWLLALAKDWRCHFVLASGSLARFWEFEKIAGDFAMNAGTQVANLIPAPLRESAHGGETKRIVYHSHPIPFDRSGLIEFVLSKPGPRLIILNTVQSAAVIAHVMREKGYDVLHLSTALAPVDREPIIKKIKRRLSCKADNVWTLVATSCVEAGMDFSFGTAFRESCSIASLIQVGGRVNRHGGSIAAEIWDFRVQDQLLSRHSAFKTSRDILAAIFQENLMQQRTATEVVTEAMRRELMTEFDSTAALLMKREKQRDFPEVAELYRVIDSDTRLVVVKRQLIEAIEQREKVTSQELIRNSVQLWTARIKRLKIEPLAGREEIFKWTAPYDSEFLGYMKGVIPLIEADETGFLEI